MKMPTSHTVGILLGMTATIAAMFIAGCATRRDHTELLKGITTKEIKLDPKNTHAPEIRLRIPEVFETDWTPSDGPDTFIIFDPTDSEDSVQRAMLIVKVAADPFKHIADSLDTRHTRSNIAGGTVEWRERSFKDDAGKVVHQREALREGVFKLVSDPRTNRPLVLQVFVVGTDSSLVEQLMGSAETISVGGGRPDA